MEGKYWLKLFRKWKNKGKDGFSIPFIIGSQQYLSDIGSSQNVEALILDVVENSGETALLRYCFHIGDLILAVSPAYHHLSNGRYPLYRGEKQTNFCVSKFVDDLGDSIEGLISILNDRYEGHIGNGDYSINDGKRSCYSPDESDFIRSCFEE